MSNFIDIDSDENDDIAQDSVASYDTENAMSDLSGPYARIHLVRIRGTDLLAADRNGFSDPYLLVSTENLKAEAKYRTSVKYKTLEPDWRRVSGHLDIEKGELFGSGGAAEPLLKFDVYDEDHLYDDYLGSGSIAIRQLAFNFCRRDADRCPVAVGLCRPKKAPKGTLMVSAFVDGWQLLVDQLRGDDLEVREKAFCALESVCALSRETRGSLNSVLRLAVFEALVDAFPRNVRCVRLMEMLSLQRPPIVRALLFSRGIVAFMWRRMVDSHQTHGSGVTPESMQLSDSLFCIINAYFEHFLNELIALDVLAFVVRDARRHRQARQLKVMRRWCSHSANVSGAKRVARHLARHGALSLISECLATGMPDKTRLAAADLYLAMVKAGALDPTQPRQAVVAKLVVSLRPDKSHFLEAQRTAASFRESHRTVLLEFHPISINGILHSIPRRHGVVEEIERRPPTDEMIVAAQMAAEASSSSSSSSSSRSPAMLSRQPSLSNASMASLRAFQYPELALLSQRLGTYSSGATRRRNVDLVLDIDHESRRFAINSVFMQLPASATNPARVFLFFASFEDPHKRLLQRRRRFDNVDSMQRLEAVLAASDDDDEPFLFHDFALSRDMSSSGSQSSAPPCYAEVKLPKIVRGRYVHVKLVCGFRHQAGDTSSSSPAPSGDGGLQVHFLGFGGGVGNSQPMVVHPQKEIGPLLGLSVPEPNEMHVTACCIQ